MAGREYSVTDLDSSGQVRRVAAHGNSQTKLVNLEPLGSQPALSWRGHLDDRRRQSAVSCSRTLLRVSTSTTIPVR